MLIIGRFDFIQDLSDIWPAPSRASQVNLRVVHFLYAQVIGLHPLSELPPKFRGGWFKEQFVDPPILFQEEKATDQDTTPPSYYPAADIPWLEESLVTRRVMFFHYFPNSTGSTVSLDDSYTGCVNGLGAIQTRCAAKIVSLALPCQSM